MIETSIDLERHLAVAQLKHYLYLQQCAIAVGDKVEVRRTTDIIDQLTTENGVGVLHEAQEEYK
jgi:NAD-dependent DNA ligase